MIYPSGMISALQMIYADAYDGGGALSIICIANLPFIFAEIGKIEVEILGVV